MIRAQKSWRGVGFLVSTVVAIGCGAEPGSGESIETVAKPIWNTTSDCGPDTTFFDDSAAPVHVQVKICTTCAEEHPSMDCQVDYGYALVGGGAWAQYTGPGALLTESYPDGMNWHTSSKDHVWYDSHKLQAYAIGIRIEGINSEVLRSQLIDHEQLTGPSWEVAAPSQYVSPLVGGEPTLKTLIGGGAAAISSGAAGQLLTATWPAAGSGTAWIASSKDHLVSSPGQVVVHGLGLRLHDILLRGAFGVDIRRMAGPTASVSTGVGTSSQSVSSGWALASIGAQATTTSGPGRLLSRVGIYNNDPRSVIAASKDHGQVSAGATTVYWNEIRKTPGSHSMCNVGTPMSGSTADWCVARVCQADSYCCNNSWDGICVGEVTSLCGESCADYTCSAPNQNLSYWNDGGTIQTKNNCYNYATNHRTDTIASPGRYSGSNCEPLFDRDDQPIPNPCFSTATLGLYAQYDGLIATTLSQGCSGGRTLVALAINPGWDYHWYRQDTNGYWSHKQGSDPATDRDLSGNLIVSPETANRGVYTEFGGYFCSCSSSVEGQGRTVIR